MDKNLFLAVGLSIVVILFWMSLVNRPSVRPEMRPVVPEQQTSVLPSGADNKTALAPAVKSGAAVSLPLYSGETDFISFTLDNSGGFSVFALKNGEKKFFNPSEKPFLAVQGMNFKLEGAEAGGDTVNVRMRDEKSRLKLQYVFFRDKNYFDMKWTEGTVPLNFYLSNGIMLESDTARDNIASNNFAHLTGGKMKRESKPALLDITPEWFAVENKYYTVGFFPAVQERIGVEIRKSLSGYPEMSMTVPGASGEVRLYAGEKSYLALGAFRPGFDRLVDFGYFREIGKIIFHVLKFFFRVTGNYGVAIILMTILVQMLMIPLTLKNMKSMKAMRDIQPLVNDLRIKYKNDPAKMNTEMMALYKQKKVNPFGGCLPMVLQIPIFWALFTTLRNLVELKSAGFFWWIKDLSIPDRAIHLSTALPFLGNYINIMPLVMGATMYIQQKMTPASGDAAQAKMMAVMMPVMFTFMFWSFPSGLVLYWLISNILSVVTQVSYEKKLIPYFKG